MRAIGRLRAPARLLERAAGGRLGELAGDEVVAQVALGDVDDGSTLAEMLDVPQEDGGRHRLAVVAPAAAAALAVGVVAPTLVDVRQQRQLACTLHRASDLALVAPAGAGDPPRTDLALLGDELAQRGRVLLVGLLDLLLAVRA